MVAYSFQKQFAEPIIAGTKRQTIRVRARAKPGDRLQLYTGMRTKSCRKIGDAICASVAPIEVRLAANSIRVENAGFAMTTLTGAQLDEFARLDGFLDWASMKAFFAKHHPGVETFEGALTTWRDFTPAIEKSRATAAAAPAAAAAKRREP